MENSIPVLPCAACEVRNLSFSRKNTTTITSYMLALMGFRNKSSTTAEAAPVSEGLLPIVRDRLQEEVFEKSKGKFLCTIDSLGSDFMAFSESSDVPIVTCAILVHSFILLSTLYSNCRKMEQ